MKSTAQRIAHAAAVKARYHARIAAGLCVTCEDKRKPREPGAKPGEGDTSTQCRGCADYRISAAKMRAA